MFGLYFLLSFVIVNYIGSKYRLAPFLKENILATVKGDLKQMVFCDLFAGTGIVAKTFKPLVKKVIANDFEYFSFVLLRNYIGNHLELDSDSYIEQLNALDPSKGFIYNNYCEGSGSERNYFSNENGQKIDVIRQQIEAWKIEGSITENLYYFLLASLLESADKVANTASVYGAFLKHIKVSAKKKLILAPALFPLTENAHDVFQKDSNELISKIEGDILYLDPPYNARQYGANYHMLNTIAQYQYFIPKGKTGLPVYRRSQFCKKGEVRPAFAQIIEKAKFQYIFLSYNNEGLMSHEEIKSIMEAHGEYDLITRPYQRFKADRDENRAHKAKETLEYLHILKK